LVSSGGKLLASAEGAADCGKRDKTMLGRVFKEKRDNDPVPKR
jgi:hypothetical protein